MNKYYLESNLMAGSPSSHLDSLDADLQMHALSVSDGLAKVLTTLGSGSLTTYEGFIQRCFVTIRLIFMNISLIFMNVRLIFMNVTFINMLWWLLWNCGRTP